MNVSHSPQIHIFRSLWEYKLPVPAFATPTMYEVNGKQFIAIACGGEKLGTEKGNMIIAFSLKQKIKTDIYIIRK